MEVLGRYSNPGQHLTGVQRALRVAHKPGPPRSRSRVPRTHKVAQRLDSVTREQIAADYQAGLPTRALMARYQLGKGTVLRIFQQASVEVRHQSLTPDQLTEAIQLYQDGWSLGRVRQHFDRDASLIHITFKGAGVPRRKPWERPSTR